MIMYYVFVIVNTVNGPFGALADPEQWLSMRAARNIVHASPARVITPQAREPLQPMVVAL
jgi:hypothetical protein